MSGLTASFASLVANYPDLMFRGAVAVYCKIIISMLLIGFQFWRNLVRLSHCDQSQFGIFRGDVVHGVFGFTAKLGAQTHAYNCDMSVAILTDVRAGGGAIHQRETT